MSLKQKTYICASVFASGYILALLAPALLVFFVESEQIFWYAHALATLSAFLAYAGVFSFLHILMSADKKPSPFTLTWRAKLRIRLQQSLRRIGFPLLGTALCAIMLQAQIIVDDVKARHDPYRKTVATTPVISARDLAPYIYNAAIREGIDPLFFTELIRQESSFNPHAKSLAGAYGLTQMIPATAARHGVTNITDIEESLRGGARELRRLFVKFQGRADLVLAAYNAGENAVEAYLYGEPRCCQTNGKLINSSRRKTGGIPPYAETEHYVAQILGTYGRAKATLRQYGWTETTPISSAALALVIPQRFIPRASVTPNAPTSNLAPVPKDVEELLNDYTNGGWNKGIKWGETRNIVWKQPAWNEGNAKPNAKTLAPIPEEPLPANLNLKVTEKAPQKESEWKKGWQ